MKTLAAETILILRNDLRLLWRDVRSGKLRALSSGALAGLVLIALHFATILLCLNLPPPPLMVETLIWAFFGFIMLGSAMNHAISLLFERADFDLLLASPISSRAVLLARLASMTVGAFASAGIFLLPLIDGAIIGFSPRYLAGFVVWLLLAALVASGGIWFSLVLVRWLGPRRARTWVQVIAGILGAAIYLTFQSQNFVPIEDRVVVWRSIQHFFSRPVLSTVARAGRGEMLPLAALLSLTALVMSLTTRQLSRVFITGVQEAGARVEKPRTIQSYRFVDGLRAATFRKDLRLIVRDPLLLSQVLPSAMYFLPLIFTFGHGQFASAIPALAVALGANFSIILTAVATAGDEGWDLIRMSPASGVRVRLGKLAAGVALPLALAFLLCLIAAIFGQGRLALLAWLVSVAAAVGCAWLEVVVVKPTPRQDIVRRQGARRSWGRSMAQFGLLSFGAAGVAFVSRDLVLLGSVFLGVLALGVIACFTLAEIEDLPTE